MERYRQIRLVRRPAGEPSETDFAITEQPLKGPAEGEMLIRILYLSVDPWLRFLMSEVTSLVPPAPLNEVFGGEAVGEVIESRLAGFQAGDIVKGGFGWQEYALSDGHGVEQIDPVPPTLSSLLGILGTTGLTAYFGLVDIGKPSAGETVVISSAAGAVGSAAGQMAKLLGRRVVGIAGSEPKARYLLDELGFDSVVNYKTAADLTAALQDACPDGVDIYFDNVGGPITESVFPC
ncbi:NADP-dependent oxidoreductase [Paenibacillus sp. P26]|nr:NADP-dependent oxidoreductase [Paenibacillus sp. P26]UUZ94082.1 NADP-dependent oxidoreductase [Paenibacillus sp. P25]